MPDIGWAELAIVAVLALIVIGPKDLPQVMRTVGKWMRKARSISREFQSSMDEMVREAELEDARKAIGNVKGKNFRETIENTIDPDGEVKQAAREIRDETRRDSGSKKSGGKSKKKAAESESAEPESKATIVKQPLNIAPPHSVTPPAEPASGDSAASSAPSGEQKTASGSG